MTTIGSRFAKREHKVHLDESSSDSEMEDGQILAIKHGKGDDYHPVKGEPGLAYKVLESNGKRNLRVREYHNLLWLIPGTLS